ncbi:MAG: peptide/nickel transport system permease protein [Nocardioidaceae bacterium]|jgi:peptide/nickel transport system permease protein|nr:peptide/nickel transport system permease protein [Nocardioidaceae bacterium]
MGLSPVTADDILVEGVSENVPVAGKSPSQIAFQRLRQDKMAVVCTAILVVLVLLAVFAPLITKAMGIYWDVTNPKAPDPSSVLEFDGYPAIGPPFHGFIWSHPLGLAPQTASDNFAYLLYGLRTSLIVALLATIFSTIIGLVLGLLAGFSRGWLDRVISFITDLFLSFPSLLGMLALAPIIVSNFSDNLSLLSKAQFVTLCAVLVLFGWMYLTRLIRGQVLSLREREFIQAAEVIGVPTRQILFKELLPNLIAPMVVATSLALPGFVALEAGLSFLGLGLTSIPSLGKMVADSASYYSDYPLYLWAPVTVFILLTLSLNLLGDSIRDAFDPKTRR